MSWTDRGALRTIWYLANKYDSQGFIETGTYKGTNILVHVNKFPYVAGCEIKKEYFKIACLRTQSMLFEKDKMGWNFFTNIYLHNTTSPKFLKNRVKNKLDGRTPIFYLDAHFYDKKLPKNKRFVIKEELKAMRGIGECCIVVHDFCNGLGSIRYDEVDLDMKMLKPLLLKINPKFQFYTNTLEGCDIVQTPDDVQQLGLTWDKEMRTTLEFVWSKPVKTYRGLLYALPSKLTKKEMRELCLRKID